MSNDALTNLSELEQLVLSHYLVHGAQDLNLVGRFWPKADLVLIIQDKMQVATRKFGSRAVRATEKPARAFLDYLLDRGAFSTIKQDLGGTMHQFQGKEYQAALDDLKQGDSHAGATESAAPEYWESRFAALTGR